MFGCLSPSSQWNVSQLVSGFESKLFTSSFLDVLNFVKLWVVAPWRTIAAGGTPHWAESCTPHEAKGCSPHESKG